MKCLYRYLYLCGGLIAVLCNWGLAQEQVAEVAVSVAYRGNVPLADLSTGARGRGWLIYYLNARGPTRPSLVVQLSKGNTSQVATAQVYDAPDGLGHVPVRLEARGVRFLQPLSPTITLASGNGVWTTQGRPNYNLDITVSGPVLATWLGLRWFEDIPRGQDSVNILVRDREGDGVPDWDLRRVLPEFRSRAFVRTNYAERTCQTPLQFDLGVSPLWPFVALGGAGGYEQPYGRALLVPPIRVDWRRAKVTSFGEMVTVRNQNCAYAFYSIPALAIGELNETNFESPFAFYDLSNEGVGYPNLILRTDHFPALDFWSSGIDPSDPENSPVPSDYERIRYSWRNAVGDGYWDYKVEVLGFYPYTFRTPIADGLARIDAPPYARFPGWVTERNWPMVTFIDAEGNGYRSSEGIYEWSPEEIGLGYLLGRQPNPDFEGFNTLPEGFRGEYRYRRNLPPELYLSPIDNRFHLLGADGGLWDVGTETRIALGNLSGGLYLDHWRVMEPNSRADLIDLGRYLLYADATGLTIKATDAPRVLTTTLPPSDAASWRAFRALAASYNDRKRSPTELGRWLEGFEGPTLTLPNVHLARVRGEGSVIRFVLTVTEEARGIGDLELPGLRNLAPGRYLVTFERRTDSWKVTRATPPVIRASLESSSLHQLTPGELTITLSNKGVLDWSGAVTLEIDGYEVKRWDSLLLPGGSSFSESVGWVPARAGRLEATLRGGGKTLRAPVQVEASARVEGLEAFGLSTLAPTQGVAVLLAFLLFISCFSFWHLWRSP